MSIDALTQPVRLLGLILLPALLVGCLSSLLPKDEDSRHFGLPDGQLESSSDRSLPSLVVDEPIPAPRLESTNLLVISATGEVQRLGGARWVALPAKLVQDGMVQRLRQLDLARSVDQRALRIGADWRLSGELRALQYDPRTRMASVALELHLICTTQAHSLGQRAFVGEQAPNDTDPAAIVAALGLALDQLAVEVGNWLQAQPADACAVDAASTSDGFESRRPRSRRF